MLLKWELTLLLSVGNRSQQAWPHACAAWPDPPLSPAPHTQSELEAEAWLLASPFSTATSPSQLSSPLPFSPWSLLGPFLHYGLRVLLSWTEGLHCPPDLRWGWGAVQLRPPVPTFPHRPSSLFSLKNCVLVCSDSSRSQSESSRVFSLS